MTLQLTPRLSGRPARYPNRIREYRVQAHLTQAALGTLLERNRKVISAWECGYRFPAGPVVLRLAKALGTLVESLYQNIYCTFHPSERKDPTP
jgi:DNA-binding XRE family transcriptional regulator